MPCVRANCSTFPPPLPRREEVLHKYPVTKKIWTQQVCLLLFVLTLCCSVEQNLDQFLTCIPKEKIGLNECYFRWWLQASFLHLLLMVCQLAATLLKSDLLFPKPFSCVGIFHRLTTSAPGACRGTSILTYFSLFSPVRRIPAAITRQPWWISVAVTDRL